MVTDTIDIEVVYATPLLQRLISLTVPRGTTMREAVRLSGVMQETDSDWMTAPLGIFGERVKQPESREVMAGERVEVYRPLICDPKKRRRNRAAS